MGKKTNDKLRQESIRLGEEKAYENIFDNLDDIASIHKTEVRKLLSNDSLNDLSRKRFQNKLKYIDTKLKNVDELTKNVKAYMPGKKKFKNKVLDEIDRLQKKYFDQASNLTNYFNEKKTDGKDLKRALERLIELLTNNDVIGVPMTKAASDEVVKVCERISKLCDWNQIATDNDVLKSILSNAQQND